MEDCIIEIENLNKNYKTDSGKVSALKNVNLKVERGEIMGVIGFSGAGKSTLVRCINKLEIPDGGKIKVLGEDISKASGAKLLRLRRKMGMIFQNFNLLSQRNVLKNVTFPLEIAKVKRAERTERAKRLLEEVRLSDKLKAYPSQLSGGQKQRVAIARALASNPEILLCDEATSALDPQTAVRITALLKDVNKEYGLTLVVISHQIDVVKRIATRVLVLDGGRAVETGDAPTVFASPRAAATKRLFISEELENE